MVSLSIIIPIYNVERYLEECLDSVLNQVANFDEIILVNDGSSDRSLEICEKYCVQYPEIIFVNQKNWGLAAARNIGMKRATGDYIVFLDSDDYISRNMCHKIKEYLNLYEVDALFYNASMQYDIPAAEKVMTHLEELDYQLMPGRDYLYKAFPESYSSSACLAAYRTGFLKRKHIFFSPGVYFEDNLFSLKVALEAHSIRCVPDKLYIRRCRDGSIMTGKVTEKKCTDMVSVQRSMWEYLKEKKVDADNVSFTSKFVFAGMLHAIGYINQAPDEDLKNMQIREFLYIAFEMWMPLFHRRRLSVEQMIVFFVALREIQKWDKREQIFFINRFWESEKQYLLTQQEFREQLEMEIRDRMRKLPFDKENYRVGVYGIGRHTQAVLNLYRRLVDAIRCDLFFVVTEKTNDEFYNCPVLSVSECKETVDTIIISSRLYQQEMKENLAKIGIDESKMILLYQRGDICDLITVDEILSF